FALGLGDQLVGVTHECDYPPEAATKTVITRATVVDQAMASAEIDAAVASHRGGGGELYGLDVVALERLAPDLIVTPAPAPVCGRSFDGVGAAPRSLPTRPRVVSLDPYWLADVLENVRTVGEATGRRAEAEKLVSWLQTRLDLVEERTAEIQRPPRVF